MKDIFKKIIVLTYITFILISFFTPFNLSFAQDESGQCTPPKKLIGGYCVDPLGTCTYSDGTKTSPIVRSVCENKEGRMGLDGKIKQGTWDESGQCTPPKKLIGGYCVDPLGTCTYSDGTKTSPIVRSVCENKEGRMGLDGKIKQGTWDESGQCTPPKKLIGGYCVDPLGTCTYSDGTKTSPIVRSVCENKEGRMGLDGKIKQGTWDESGQCTPPKKLIGGYCVDPLGTCTYSDGTKTSPIVRSVCEN